MKKREPLMTVEHFEDRISSRTNHIKEYETELQDFDDLSGPYYTLYMDNLKLLTSKYSAGFQVDELKDNANQTINWFIKNKQHPKSDNVVFDDLDFYLDYIHLYSLGIIFNIDKKILDTLLNLIGNEGKDALLDQLALYVQPNREQGNKLQHPKAYQPLFDTIMAPKDDKPKLMQKFLKGWYKSMRKCSWHDIHLSPGKYNFNGYWCWEAAMVTLLYDMDDSSYRDMPFYPKDMVDYARQHKQ
ncbi:PoNe immunity protein domain-containing protein [Pedobacter sp. N23S346]|uniref:PoNi-like cognate immunity protein n=1 Tax=Pedobacter sp. N23S346 TaxID=3402750 RepID=UPI003AD321B9